MCTIPLPMMYVHVPLETLWPIVPMDNMVHEDPLQNINPPTRYTNVTQDSTVDRVLVLEILAWRGIEPSTTTRVGTLFQFNQQQPPHLIRLFHPITQCVFAFPIHGQQLLATFSQLISALLFNIFQYWHSGEVKIVSF